MTKDTIVNLLQDPSPKACFTIGERPWARRAVSAVAGLVLACSMAASPTALAHDVAQDKEYLEKIGVEYVELGAVQSRENESKLDFMLRTARYLDAFTRTTGHEACGTIASNDDGQWRVRLITNRAQIACVLVDFDESSDGWELTDETIHSHPLMQYSFKTNLQDNLMARLMGQGRACGGRVQTDDYNFSPRDYANGPGYLVARGRLFYQSQPGERLEIGRVDHDAPLEALEWVAPSQGKAQGIHAASAVWSQEDAEGLPRTQCPQNKR